MGEDDYSGDPALATSVGLPPMLDPAMFLPGDIYDEQQMGAWNTPAAQAQGMPWWQGLAIYGATKAIDNQFPNSPTGVWGNVYPGSAQGANGRTYSQRPLGVGGGVAQASGRFTFGGNGMGLLLMGAVALLLLK